MRIKHALSCRIGSHVGDSDAGCPGTRWRVERPLEHGSEPPSVEAGFPVAGTARSATRQPRRDVARSSFTF